MCKIERVYSAENWRCPTVRSSSISSTRRRSKDHSRSRRFWSRYLHRPTEQWSLSTGASTRFKAAVVCWRLPRCGGSVCGRNSTRADEHGIGNAAQKLHHKPDIIFLRAQRVSPARVINSVTSW
jgi:hypothetical protein